MHVERMRESHPDNLGQLMTRRLLTAIAGAVLLLAGACVLLDACWKDDALRRALADDNYPQVRILLARGSRSSPKPGAGTQTPLCAAAAHGDAAWVQRLLREGAAVDAHGLNESTPLIAAARGGHGSVVRLLLRAGAQVDAEDDQGLTALYWASGEPASDPCVADLLAHGARHSVTDGYNATPLMKAAMFANLAAARALIRAGADVSCSGIHGDNPLSLARTSGSREMVALLKATGARDDTAALRRADSKN